MNKKNQTILFWIGGIIIFLLVATQLPISPWFALVTTVTCADGIEHYYPLDGTLVDMKNGQDATNNGAIFSVGKLGSNSLEFNGNNSISFPTLNPNLSVGLWMNDYSETAGWTYKTYSDTSILNSESFLGLNGSVDEISVGENITTLFSTIQPCYLTVTEENVSCKDYATDQVTDPGNGCLNYTGDFFPNCTYAWEDTSGFFIVSNTCQKRSECKDILPSDYSTLALCQAELTTELNETISTPTSPAPYTATPTDTTTLGSIKDKLNEEVFTIAGFEVKLIHLAILLVLVIVVLYFMGAKKK